MTDRALMGIDIGTSSTKAVIIDINGRILAVAAQEYRVETPHPGWAEQSPETWMQAALSTMRRALTEAAISPDVIQAIGLSGQMHGTVCLDTQGSVLRPAIIWADQRSEAQVMEVYRCVGRENLAAWTGNPLATGFMLATWLWLREYEPEVAHATTSLLVPKDYVRYRLTGELGTEPSDASSTLLFDTAQRRWSEPLLDALDINSALLSPVYESAAIAGELLPAVAEATGLRVGTPVIYGGSDQAMQALGHGVIAPDVMSSTIGTGGQVFVPISRPIIDPELRMHCFCHILPDMWHAETAMLSAGLSLKWLRDNVLIGSSYQDLADAAQTIPPGSEGLFFMPYLAGERTPYMDPQARGGFVGLTLRHGQGHLARAVMEGVVFGMRQGVDLMIALGVQSDRVVASGGAAQHPLWVQLQADIYNRPICRTLTVEAAATGAALLAGVGVGVYPDAEVAVKRAVRWHDSTIYPNSRHTEMYAKLYMLFCQLYPRLVAHFHALRSG